MTVSIIGAGMAGLLAGAMFGREAQIYEAAPSLPNNHHALLRFRSDDIAQHLNIPFQAVDVIKIVKPWRNKVADTIGYSLKSNGKASLRSIRSAEGKVDKRFIAPPDFIQQLAERQQRQISFGNKVSMDMLDRMGMQGPVMPILDRMGMQGPVISTIPMPKLMELLEYPERPEFGHRHGWVIKATVGVPSDFCGTIYYPDPASPVIRATLTGDLLQIELISDLTESQQGMDDFIVAEVLKDFGLERYSYEAVLVQQQYAKILPIDDRLRRKFIMWATDEYGIYSLGRFAVWKPGLLLDDVFHDIRKIQAMLRAGGCNYKDRLK